MDDLLNALLVWGMTLTGYGEPDKMPLIEPVSQQHLIETLCAGRFCSAVAYYDNKSSTIYYDERLQIAHERSAQGFILHELVHFLQHNEKPFEVANLSCEQRIDLEREAYRVQKYFLSEHKQNTFEIEMAITALNRVCDF